MGRGTVGGTQRRYAALVVGLAALLAASPVAAGESAWSRQTEPAPGPARVIGGYTHGCIAGAVALPLDGPGYTVLRPQRLRYFGHPALIAVIRDLGAWADRHGWGTLLVGDLSQPRGGPMSYGHASHEAGLDADIWLRLLPPGQRLSDAERRDPTPVSMVRTGAPTADPAVWTDTHAALVRAAAQDPRVARLFVNPAIKATLCRAFPPDADGNTRWLQKVRAWYGHDSHVHIRLHCPSDSPGCVPQDPPPPGAGCEAEGFAWWANRIADRLTQKASAPAPVAAPVAGPPQSVPEACGGVLSSR
ncbi:penicillin-insensitive murein endopeptidase [Roseospira navarrensis]|uniref:Penicillin-insensitive murein endopeptidase n=1 Tax=Roseospira navarrensis TaxID=140058 RepID=A0A7X2D1Z6_9PROT|nr:penicillin-insensitive murein endopeptidase [Roseospira navarrensis]MQX35151.1 penicillin-insensitive murein endopeptidase [Roseospira navarrensis]